MEDLNYNIAERYKFNQSYLTNNKHMNTSGACFGLSIDWIRHYQNNPETNYILDKYNLKYSVSYNLDVFAPIYHIIDSKNYYNRINYFQKKANLEYWKADKADFSAIENHNMPDVSFIAFIRKGYGHACAYKITQNDVGYKYVYFDPNFGEKHSVYFNSRNETINDLKHLINVEAIKYTLYKPEGTEIYTMIFKDSLKFANYLTNSWKHVKNEIEAHGTYENSMNYHEMPYEIFTRDYYQA